MKSYDWQRLDEAGKYEVWSEHVGSKVKYIDYVRFCDLMDEFTAPVVYYGTPVVD